AAPPGLIQEYRWRGRPKTHRLIVHQAHPIVRKKITLEPGRLVDQHRKGAGMALGKGKAAECAQLVKHLLGNLCRNSLLSGASYECLVQLFNFGLSLLGAQRSPQQLSLTWREAGKIMSDF